MAEMFSVLLILGRFGQGCEASPICALLDLARAIEAYDPYTRLPASFEQTPPGAAVLAATTAAAGRLVYTPRFTNPTEHQGAQGGLQYTVEAGSALSASRRLTSGPCTLRTAFRRADLKKAVVGLGHTQSNAGSAGDALVAASRRALSKGSAFQRTPQKTHLQGLTLHAALEP